jgi:DNA-binding response OmpR family regulator/predicted regulator of Ras-like GTPase activity (Roadblock/LC7/MglB family)
MKTVLIVDDDESFLHSLIDGFKAYEDKFAIATAGDGIDAVATLKKQKINLVLTDLKMPRMDGFELVAHLGNNYPNIPIIIMTAFGTPEMEENLRDMGTFQYIEKPIDFKALVDKIIQGLNGPSKGFITGVSLSSFLQLLELDKKTCTLTIHAGSKKGTMHFRDGVLLDAISPELQGSEAAYIIVSWKNVEIEIENSCPIEDKNIAETLGFILLEGSRRKDEAKEMKRIGNASSDTALSSLESLNMEDLDLDLDLSMETIPAPKQAHPEKTIEQTATNPLLDQFINLLSSFPEIGSSTISSKDGTVLHQSDEQNSNTANFITYVAETAEQVKVAIGVSGQQYSLFTLKDDSRLLVLCGEEVVVGVTLDSSVPPEPIANGLRPVLKRIQLKT